MKVLRINYNIVTGADAVLVEMPYSRALSTSRSNKTTQKLPQAPYIKVKGAPKKPQQQKAPINANHATNQITTTAQTDVAESRAHQCNQIKKAQGNINRAQLHQLKQNAYSTEIPVNQKPTIVLTVLPKYERVRRACAAAYDELQRQRFDECVRALYYNGK